MNTKDKLTEIINNVVVNEKGNRIRDVFHPEFVEKIVDALIKNYTECMKDYAREIFEEIGKILYKHTNAAIKEKSVTAELTIDYIGEGIANLKERYTKGGEKK